MQTVILLSLGIFGAAYVFGDKYKRGEFKNGVDLKYKIILGAYSAVFIFLIVAKAFFPLFIFAISAALGVILSFVLYNSKSKKLGDTFNVIVKPKIFNIIQTVENDSKDNAAHNDYKNKILLKFKNIKK